MRYLRPFSCTAFLIALLFISTALAAEIRMGSFEYNYGKAAMGSHSHDVFVICESCPARQQLALRPRATTLAIHSAEEQLYKTPPDVPEKRLENEPPRVQTATTETVRPACVDHCLQPVYFRFDHSDLSDYEKDQLARLVSCMKGDSEKVAPRIQITGHTCDMGSVAHNDRLSLMRAKAVAVYLMEHGFDITEDRGEGMSRPISRIRSLNRRVEIKVVH